MRKYVAIVASLLLFGLLHADDQPTSGKIKSARGKCTATFPAKPKLESEKTSDMYVLGENNDKHGYVLHIGSVKQPVDLNNEESIKKAMDVMYLQLKSSLGTKASKMMKGTFGADKLPTRYYEFDLSDGVYWTRVVLTKDCIISITVSGPKEWAQGEKAQAFLKSLKFETAKK